MRESFYDELLRNADDAECSERPADFDEAKVDAKFRKLVSAIEAEYLMVDVDAGLGRIQDASFYGDVRVVRTAGRPDVIVRVSNFAELATVFVNEEPWTQEDGTR